MSKPQDVPKAQALLVPLQLDAFVLNKSSCDGDNHYRIAPITQPNYTFMRLTDNLIVPDILDHIDLHDAAGIDLNSRVTDIGSGKLRQSRLGVYLSWQLPQVYRQASAAAPDANGNVNVDHAHRKLAQGYPASSSGSVPTDQLDYSVPEFRPVPNRWLVTRRIESYQSPDNSKFPTFQSWIVESDRITNINDADCPQDLEAERTPFINPDDLKPVNDAILDSQAEIFIGRKTLYDNFFDPKEQTARDQAPKIDPLTVATSGNLLFPDYQPHNNNVFSIVDNFEYKDKNGGTQYLTQAKADYFVIGWHTRSDHDPGTTDPKLRTDSALKDDILIQQRLVHSRRLKDCNMVLKDSNDLTETWLNDSSDFRILCHASKYDVVYNATGFGDTRVVAEDVGKTLRAQQSVSVGTTAIEALIAYCRAHIPAKAPSDSGDGSLNLDQIEEYLIRLSTLLQTASSEDVDALQAAIDEQFVQAFKHTDGGPTWHFQQTTLEQTGDTQKTKKSAQPSEQDNSNLRSLNVVQALLSAIQKRMTENSWKLFAEWWLFVSNFGSKSDPKDRVNALLNERSSLAGQQTNLAASFVSLQTSLTDKAYGKQPQKGTSDRFYQRKEPTILLGNTKSGWDDDFSDLLQTRLDFQVVKGQDPDLKDSHWMEYLSHLTSKPSIGDERPTDGVIGKIVPPELGNSALKLYREFYLLRSIGSQLKRVPSPQVLPYYYDSANPALGRDRWQNTQPFKPLFLEWEVMYFHIPYDKFKLGAYPHQTGASVCQYGFDTNQDVSKLNIQDIRTSSGRTILLPQSQTSLKTILQSVFSNTNPDLLKSDAYKLDPAKQQTLLDNVGKIEFISAPLTGLTEDLLTIHQGGMHVKPTVRLPNQKPIVIDAARRAFQTSDSRASNGLFDNLGSETKELPYGGSVILSASGPCPMKPVTHGQLMLTKLNIIDRFGQAVSVTDPKPHFRTAAPGKVTISSIAPCLSDSYFPGRTSDGRPNTVLNNGQACTMIQLTPSINQPARINAGFVLRDPTTRKWRIASEWDNPIWGWMVINYAESGLQFYTKEGYFYREVRQGGPTGQTAGLKWLPFNPPSQVSSPTQLDHLIDKLAHTTGYLQGFFDLLNQSISEQQVGAPTAYSQYTSSIIGKPVALTSFGWSLELADPPRANYSTSNPKAPDSIFSYSFPMKIGDKDRVYDGLIGLFNCNHDAPDGQTDYNLDKLWTYFLADKAKDGDPRAPLTSASIKQLQAYYDDPLQPQQAVDKMEICGAIMDPYVPVHMYTSILPNVSLKLPDWTTQDALQKITAFLHAGPLITPIDVPPLFQSEREVKSETSGIPLDVENTTPKMILPLKRPSGAMNGAGAEWRWLQPYVIGVETKFNAFGISDDAATGADASQAKLLPGPYTAVEGFLQVIKTPAPPADAKT